MITENACAGGTGSFSITFDATGAEIASGPMVETPTGSGHYEGSAPRFDQLGIHGYATVHVSIHCPDPNDDDDFDVTIYLDPSGNVVDKTGAPVAATVTLLRSDSDAGPFEAVPNGSALMSPANRVNPDVTDSAGHYGWDVIAGFYKVRAEKSGCGSTESSVLKIPPPVTISTSFSTVATLVPTPVARGIENACPPGQIPDAGFTDVPSGNVHKPAINCMAFYGIANGRSSTEYAPSLGVNRAQMASFIARLIASAGITLADGRRVPRRQRSGVRRGRGKHQQAGQRRDRDRPVRRHVRAGPDREPRPDGHVPRANVRVHQRVTAAGDGRLVPGRRGPVVRGPRAEHQQGGGSRLHGRSGRRHLQPRRARAA